MVLVVSDERKVLLIVGKGKLNNCWVLAINFQQGIIVAPPVTLNIPVYKVAPHHGFRFSVERATRVN